MMKKIVIIEDSEELQVTLAEMLSQFFSVFSAMTGKEGLKMVRELNPSLVILDLKLPDIDGFEVCKRIKESSKTKRVPVMMLSGVYKTPAEKARGINLGASDYVEKPFSKDELLARIKGLVSRDHTATDNVFKAGGVELFNEEREVHINKKKIKLTKTEFDILYLLMSRKGVVVKKEFILYWFSCEENSSEIQSLYGHIKNLRRKLGIKGKLIKTVVGIGYKFDDGK